MGGNGTAKRPKGRYTLGVAGAVLAGVQSRCLQDGQGFVNVPRQPMSILRHGNFIAQQTTPQRPQSFAVFTASLAVTCGALLRKARSACRATFPTADGTEVEYTSAEEQRERAPQISITEGQEPVSRSQVKPPSGKSSDESYYWKMTSDRRAIDVIIPVPDFVELGQVIYRMGDDNFERNRGPSLEVGYRVKDEDGLIQDFLVLDGTLTNAVYREQCSWELSELAGVKVIMLTLTRPWGMRTQHDSISNRALKEVRIEPQTWDCLLAEERETMDITHKAFMDLEFDGEPLGRCVFGLYGNMKPQVVKNFLGLCNGEYTDEEGNKKKSVWSYKGNKFSSIKEDHLCHAGDPGLHKYPVQFSHEELEQVVENFKEGRSLSRIGPVPGGVCTLAWGADLGLSFQWANGMDEPMVWGKAVSQLGDYQEKAALSKLAELVAKGQGAELVIIDDNWSLGTTAAGGLMKDDDGQVVHRQRGMLSMDYDKKRDRVGSNFFITFREIPAMDRTCTAFGELIEGFDVLDKIEENDGGGPLMVIADCGELV